MPLWFVSSVFLAVPMVANAAMRGVGNAFWPSVVMVSFAIINAILDPMFIFGYGIIPAFGIKGAAIASVFAASIACLMAFYILAIRENLLSLKCLLEKSVWGKASRTLLVIAIPVSLGSLILPIVSYIYTGFLADIGNTAVAAFGVVTRLEAFILIPIMAIAGGMAPLIGQNYGAGAYDRILKALSQASVFIACYAIISGVVAFIAATYLANIFSNSHETGIFIRDYMMIVPLSYIGLYFFAMLGSVLNALNRAKEGLYLMIIRSFAIAVPIAAYLTHTHGENGFLWSIVITNGLALLMAVAYLQSIRCALRSKSLS
jgi:Na+-driven multidrug efflux pump